MWPFSRNTKEQFQDTLNTKTPESERVIASIQKFIPFIEFDPQGYVLDCNDLFLGAVGYSKNEVVGQHHKMFCPESVRTSQAYSSFWSRFIDLV